MKSYRGSFAPRIEIGEKAVLFQLSQRFDPSMVCSGSFIRSLVRFIRGLTQTNCLAEKTAVPRFANERVRGAHVDEDPTSGRKLYVRLVGHAVISPVFFFCTNFSTIHVTPLTPFVPLVHPLLTEPRRSASFLFLIGRKRIGS